MQQMQTMTGAEGRGDRSIRRRSRVTLTRARAEALALSPDLRPVMATWGARFPAPSALYCRRPFSAGYATSGMKLQGKAAYFPEKD